MLQFQKVLMKYALASMTSVNLFNVIKALLPVQRKALKVKMTDLPVAGVVAIELYQPRRQAGFQVVRALKEELASAQHVFRSAHRQDELASGESPSQLL